MPYALCLMEQPVAARDAVMEALAHGRDVLVPEEYLQLQSELNTLYAHKVCVWRTPRRTVTPPPVPPQIKPKLPQN